MAMLLQNRTISMILTVPDVKELTSSLSHSVDNTYEKSLSFSKNPKPPSIPIYHGSIIRVEQHHDKQNTSDLIVRVPNFHYSSLSTVTISTSSPNIHQLSEIETRRETSFKRRAPICPVLNGSHHRSLSSNRIVTHGFNNSNVNQPETTNIRLTHTKRFASGLRNLSQALTTNCKSKRSTNINEIAIIPVLPDVEVIRGDLEVLSTKMNTKKQNLTSKFLPPKILSIKRKCFKIKREQSLSNSSDIQTDSEDKTMENSRTDISLKEKEIESESTIPFEFNPEVEQQSTSMAQHTSQIPIILIDSESSSTHRYSTIPRITLNFPTTTIDHDTENNSSTNIFQTDIFPSKNASTTDIQSSNPSHHDDNIEDTLYVVHPNGDTYSECYEVTYQFDPEFQQFFDNKNEQVSLPEIEDQSSMNFNLYSFENQNLTSALTTWLPIFPNNYEQIQSDNTISQRTTDLKEIKIPRVRFYSHEDLSHINDDQPIINQLESVSRLSSSPENDQDICLDEDYTVIIQLLKHVLQLDTITNDADNNEFNQIFPTD